jgi:hypothetical protein
MAAICLVAACEDYGPKIISGVPWDFERACLYDYPVAIMSSAVKELPATCEPNCLLWTVVSAGGLEEQVLYVTRVCPGALFQVVSPEEVPECGAALEAYNAEITCESPPSDTVDVGANSASDAGVEGDGSTPSIHTATGDAAGTARIDAGDAVRDAGDGGAE